MLFMMNDLTYVEDISYFFRFNSEWEVFSVAKKAEYFKIIFMKNQDIQIS